MGYLTRTDIPVADYDAQAQRNAQPQEAPDAQLPLPFLALAAGPLAPGFDLGRRIFSDPNQITAYRYARVRDNTLAERIALETAYDEFNDELFAITGQRMHNPVRQRFGAEVDFERGQFYFDPLSTSGTGVERYATVTDPVFVWHRRMAELAAADPRLAELFARSTRDNATARAEQIRQERTLAFHEYLGEGDALDQVVRGLMVAPGLITGALSTGAPEQVAQLAAGGGGRLAGAGGAALERVAARFGIGAASNIVGQAAVEPAIIEDARRMGEERTLSMVMLDFGLAGLLGGTLSTVGGGSGQRAPSEWADFELSGPSAREMRIGRARSALREALTLPPVERDVTPLDEPGSGQAVQDATAGRAESLIVASAQRDRATLAELPDPSVMSTEALVDDILANDAYVRGDPDAPNPVRTDPVRTAPAEAIEAAARQSDEAPAPPPGMRDGVTMNGRTRPRTFERFAASSLRFDAAAFQYKRSTGAQGATGRLEGVEVWDNQSAGKILVWGARDGTRYVADGHQRAALAQSISARQGSDIGLDGYLYREADGWSAQEVRNLAAQKNLRETAGDPLDTAALMREAPELIDSSIPQRGADFRMARSLARLSDEAFAAVRAGAIEPRLGAVIGEAAADRPEIHASLVQMFQRDAPGTLREANFIVREALSAPVARVQSAQISMFDDPLVLSGMRERAEILRHAVALLREDKRAFAVAARHADALEAAGNVLAAEENARRADLADALLRELDTLVTRPGPVADAMREIAARAAENKTSAKVAAQELVDTVARMLDERGLLALHTDPPLREPPPLKIEFPDMEAEARSATLRHAHDRDTEALTQTMAEVALERAMRGEVGEVIPADAIGAQREADIARIEEAAEAMGLAPDPGEIDVAAAILARADQDLADEARLRIEPTKTDGEIDETVDTQPRTFAEAAEQDADIEAPWLPDEFDDPVKLREAIDAATLPELEAAARELGVDGEARTRAEYAALFEGERGAFARGWESVSTSREPFATVAQLETALRSAFPRWADKLTERYRLSLVQSVSDLPIARDRGGSLRDTILGYAEGGQAWIVADNVSPEMLRGLTLHEIGVHVGMREMLGEAGMARVLGEIERLRYDDADIAGGYESAIRARTPESQMAEEALAYAIQYADPETMSAGLRGLIARIANSVRAWLWRTFPGLRIAGTLTFEDMRWLALGGLRHAARTEARYLDARGRWASWDDLDKMLGEDRRGGTPGLRRTVPPDFPEVGTPEYAAAVTAAREAQKSGQRLTEMQRALIRFEEDNQIPDGMFARGDTPERRGERFHDPRLTPSENKAVEMARNNFTTKEIADEMEVAETTVHQRLAAARKKGIQVEHGRTGRPPGDERGWTAAQLFALREQGLTPQQIAERTGVPNGSVRVRISRERARLRREAESLERIVRELKDCS